MSTRCKHENTFEKPPDYDVIVCEDCGKIIKLRCLACGGEGIVQEDEYKCDWVNCGPDLIVCPECKGSGWVKERMWQ